MRFLPQKASEIMVPAAFVAPEMQKWLHHQITVFLSLVANGKQQCQAPSRLVNWATVSAFLWG
jgi:hypothetical protein